MVPLKLIVAFEELTLAWLIFETVRVYDEDEPEELKLESPSRATQKV